MADMILVMLNLRAPLPKKHCTHVNKYITNNDLIDVDDNFTPSLCYVNNFTLSTVYSGLF